MAKNGHKKITITCSSALKSTIIKSVGIINLPTVMRTSLNSPFICTREQSANCRVIVVGHGSPKQSASNIDKGIKFILSPRSHNACPTLSSQIFMGRVKLLGSFSFFGKLVHYPQTVLFSKCNFLKLYMPYFFQPPPLSSIWHILACPTMHQSRKY